MTQTVLVFLNNITQLELSTVSWSVCGDKKVSKKAKKEAKPMVDSGESAFDEFLKTYQENFSNIPVTIVVSGEFITYTNVEVTIKNSRQMLQALPYMVEEQVVGNIEDLHIAASDIQEDGTIRVAIIDKILIKNVVDVFSKSNISIHAIYGLPDLLVFTKDEINIVLVNDIALIKGHKICLQCDQINLPLFADLIIGKAAAKINMLYHKNDKAAAATAAIFREKIPHSKTEVSFFSHDFHSYLIGNVLDFSASPLNIYQGELLPGGGSIATQYRRVATLAWIVCLCVLAQIGFNILSGYYLQHKAVKVEKYATSLYTNIFPNEKKVVNLAAQVNGKLTQVPSNMNLARFPNIFGVTATTLKSIGTRNDIKLQQFRYDFIDRELKIGIEATSIALVDKLKQNLSSQGFDVELVSANEAGKVIKATVLIKQI